MRGRGRGCCLGCRGCPDIWELENGDFAVIGTTLQIVGESLAEAIDLRAGKVNVSSTIKARIDVFDAAGEHVGHVGERGNQFGMFDRPKGVALDSAGHIYVVEGMNDVVQIFDASGRLLLVFGGSGAGDGQLWLPTGITIADDMVYVAYSANRRVQVFEGLCIARKSSGSRKTFTVRKVSYGVGVERIFPTHSPSIDRIEVMTRGKVRRSRLYYLRSLRGKQAKIKEAGRL